MGPPPTKKREKVLSSGGREEEEEEVHSSPRIPTANASLNTTYQLPSLSPKSGGGTKWKTFSPLLYSFFPFFLFSLFVPISPIFLLFMRCTGGARGEGKRGGERRRREWLHRNSFLVARFYSSSVPFHERKRFAELFFFSPSVLSPSLSFFPV